MGERNIGGTMKKIFLISMLILLLSACTKEIPEKQEDQYIPPPTSIVDKQFNFHVVDSGVWRSSQPNRESIIRMREHGLHSIINLRGDDETDLWEGKFADSLGINYYSKPLDATKKQDLNYLIEILSLIEENMNQPVLVHCLGGKDRTGLLIGMYKLKHTDATLEQIKQEMIMYGHDSENYNEIFAALEQFQNELTKTK